MAADYFKGPGENLLQKLRDLSEQKKLEFTTLMLITVNLLPSQKENLALWNEYDQMLQGFRDRHGSLVYRLSDTDSAFLLRKTVGYGEAGLRADLQVAILRLIKKHIPERFHELDTGRMIRLIDLEAKIRTAILIIKKSLDFEADVDRNAGKRRLSEKDILKVESVADAYGAENFVKMFVANQPIALHVPGSGFQPVLKEHFVSVGKLLSEILKGVDPRGSGNIFTQLTLLLDRIVIDGLGPTLTGTTRVAVNMNVESIFAPAFEKFLSDLPEAAARNLVIEFRQENILKNFEEYLGAKRIIGERGVTLTVDAIMPESVGVLNIPLLGAQMAKIFWRTGVEDILESRREYILKMRQEGVVFVLCRVDDPGAIAFGESLGINLFQGFLIDEKLRGAAQPAAAEAQAAEAG